MYVYMKKIYKKNLQKNLSKNGFIRIFKNVVFKF